MAAKPEQAFHQLCTLCTHQACHTEDLTLLKLKRYMAETFRIDGGEIFHFEHHFTRYILTRRIQLGKFTANHLGDDEIRGQVFGRPGSDILAVPHDRNFITDAQDLIHLVTDIDNGHAFAAQLIDDGK